MGLVVGYGARFNSVDLGRDLILPGAFSDSLRQRGPSGVRMLWQHDPAEPIGTWLALHEDKHGLYVRGRLIEEILRGRETRLLLETKSIDGLSIGYRTIKARTCDKTGIRHIEKLDLWEISVVTFPMHPDCRAALRAAERVKG